MKAISGFEPVSEIDLPEYRAHLKQFLHAATGCEVVHIHCDDPENLFSFTFRTPPLNNKGITHILEHAVLSGSHRFPLKDPFVDLLKGSMNTFLNAFTFPDKTVYPGASTVPRDYFNIMMVYGDAVFDPLLKEEVFYQEGRHYEWADDGQLKVVGVVYNEMKGSHSNPDSLAGRWAYRSLFPDTIYRYDSGGEPEEIRTLRYEELLDYHRNYYHPSNCRIFLYGDIPTETQLSFLQDNFLKTFDRLEIDSCINTGKPWKRSRSLIKSFAVKDGESEKDRSTVLLNWRLCPIDDPLLILSLELLSDVLIGNAGSPLRKILVESRLGEDIAPASGLDSELRELIFSVGLRGANETNQGRIQNLIFRTLEEIAEKGVEQELIDGALHQAEFANREIRRGGSPYGLYLMRKTLRGWLHNLEPRTTLEFQRWFSELRSRLDKDTNYLPSLIRDFLIDNSNRTRLLVKPEAGKQEREDAELTRCLQDKAAQLTARDREEIGSILFRLKDFQQNGYGMEEQSKVPSLAVGDLPRKVEIIPSKLKSFDETVLYRHNINTNGIVYVNLAYDISRLNDKWLVYLPFWCRAVRGCGIPGRRYDEMARELAAKTGGFTSWLDAGRAVGGEEKRYLFFHLKTLKENLSTAIDLVRALLKSADFNDRKRLEEMWRSMRNSFRMSLTARGNHFAALRAGSKISRSLRAEELWQGVVQYLFLYEKAEKLDTNLEAVSQFLGELRRVVLSQKPVLNATSESGTLSQVENEIVSLPPYISGNMNAFAGGEGVPTLSESMVESLVATSPVGYVAHAVPAANTGTSESAVESILAHLLSTGLLWEKIRMKGGAYGASAVSRSLNGVFTFSTYRDPNILESFNAFKEALTEVTDSSSSGQDVKGAIIGTVGRDIHPMNPGMKGFIQLSRTLFGIDDEVRQMRRDTILSTTGKKLAEAAARILDVYESGASVALAGKKAIQKAGSRMPSLSKNVLELPN